MLVPVLTISMTLMFLVPDVDIEETATPVAEEMATATISDDKRQVLKWTGKLKTGWCSFQMQIHAEFVSVREQSLESPSH